MGEPELAVAGMTEAGIAVAGFAVVRIGEVGGRADGGFGVGVARAEGLAEAGCWVGGTDVGTGRSTTSI